MLKKIVIALCLILWPLNLALNFSKLEFKSSSVFAKDYQGEQLILRNIELYPTPLFARVFQNKPRIYINKYFQNFFAIIDPNNYFFALHPRPLPGNINLYKYPFMAIIFFLIGIVYIKDSKYKKLILGFLIPSIFVLPALANYEGFDIVLWIPISLIIIHGINKFNYKKPIFFKYYSAIFILFALAEISRSFFNLGP